MITRKRILKFIAPPLILLVLYEIAFRYTTASCGEIDMEKRPPRIFYSDDLLAPFPWRERLFSLRAQLSFGKVRLSKDSGAYVEGGRFYRRLANGTWRDMTETMIEYQNTNNTNR